MTSSTTPIDLESTLDDEPITRFRTTRNLPQAGTAILPADLYDMKLREDLDSLTRIFINRASHADKDMLKTILLRWEQNSEYEPDDARYETLPLATAMSIWLFKVFPED